ncbi:MAG: glycine--tRNA ligase subunit beta [Chiayiivirga sp.]|jgi:glycyl-tRNA synthetase beta chain|uniref:glycine--tRNA ligase subunit beta n=1 Tax=Chiayiivirga sp. TaxID=2041042 RepID=UPI0025C47508|nr:glycine--tRNA ligase subunit beta [Chiayiivirga sp.]MCI1711771.1 glycine--tRNA ligase subunit beta [Chiayiivirga sp.]MCI1729649.1 glycine--tRNA ligase subunit beta [Chiayiivirga sp.]
MAAATQSLLVELGTEELPVKALPGLSEAFLLGVRLGLEKRGIGFDKAQARSYYTPRRMAVLFPGVAARQPEQRSEVLGPYLNVGLDANGQPTAALKGFAQKNGIDWTELTRGSDAKGERFVHRAVKPGADTVVLLPDILAEAVKLMPIPKPMRWGAHEFAFARPLHWLVLLFGPEVVKAELFGIKADRYTRGHRFHHPAVVKLAEPGAYVEALRAAHVLVDQDERRKRIRNEVEAAAKVAGGTARIDEGILSEVNCLTEWPRPVRCSFEREFLAVPQEALIATMEANQKFFPVLDAGGKLTEKFIGVANIDSKNEGEIRKGYERVIRPRFADAKFFFDEDRKQGLAAMNAGLSTVTYQQKLGTVADKVARVAALAEAIAPQVGVDATQARRAAELAKADLQSRLVNEFPELQGIAGRYYALDAGEAAAVAAAVDEAYMPRFAGDAIAPSKLGQVLALAERLDTLAGGFAAGLKPTGNKDPFALRRNALGLARTLIEGGIDLGHGALLEDAIAGVASAGAVELAEVRDFVFERLRSYYADQGVSALQFDAVAAVEPATLSDFDRRLKAVQAFAKLPEAEALAAANKRIRNILKKTDEAIPARINNTGLVETAELALAGALAKAEKDTEAAIQSHDYVAVLKRLAQLRAPVDEFFNGVMVMADDAALRRNRLALLKRLSDRFLQVADISQLSAG